MRSTDHEICLERNGDTQMTSTRRATLVLAACMLLFSMVAGTAGAQILGTLQGYIRGDNGEGLPGVTVSIVNQDTGAERIVITGSDGFYVARSLQAGTYRVLATLEGMQSTQQENVELLVGQLLDINLNMGVEATSEVITVTAETPLVEISRSSAASYISEVEIENIPIVNRDFKEYAILTPTVVDDPQRGFVTMSGQRGVYSGLRVDGTSNKNAFFGYGNGGEATENDGLTIAQESVKEFQVITNGFNPEYGLDGGGFINVVTKSGTNNLKGNAFYFYTDDSLAENIDASPLDKFRNPSASDTDPSEFKRQNWGATVGGPIIQDKLHYFAAYDQVKRTNPFIDRLETRGAYDAVLQRAQAEPEFASLLIGYEPNNDGVAAPDPVNGRTASGLFERNVDNLILLGKLDFTPVDAHSASLRYNYVDYERTSTFLDEESLKTEGVDSIVGGWVWVPSSRGLNDMRIQYVKDDLNRGNLRDGSDFVAQIRFRGGDGSGSDSLGKFDFLPIEANTKALEFRDAYSYLFGAHDLKFGIDYAEDNMKQLFAGSRDGRYDFNTLDQFLANDADRVRIYFGDVGFPNYDETQSVLALFAQDSWRPTGTLTVNYGLRWQKTDNPGNLDHVFPVGRSIPDDDHLAPRVGFAWNVNPEVGDVLRGGFGIFYGRTPTLLFASQVQENGLYPNYGRVTVSPGQTGFVPLGTPIDNENPPIDTIPSTSYLDPNFRDAQNTRFNLGYERPVSRNWSVAVDLLWADGKYNQRNYNDNIVVTGLDEFGRPLYSGQEVDPNFSQIFVRRSDGNSEYRAATLKVNRRFANRYSLQAHYTYSTDKDDDANERNATDITVSNNSDPGYDWGTSDRQVKQRLVGLGTAELPLGFRVGGTFTFQEGSPYGAFDSNIFGAGCPRSTTCPAPRAVINGNLVGRNTYTNEDWQRIDLRLGWGMGLGAERRIEVFANVFNLLNEQAFSVDELFNQTMNPFDVTSQQQPFLRDGSANPEFGIPDVRVTQPRYIEFGARFSF